MTSSVADILGRVDLFVLNVSIIVDRQGNITLFSKKACLLYAVLVLLASIMITVSALKHVLQKIF